MRCIVTRFLLVAFIGSLLGLLTAMADEATPTDGEGHPGHPAASPTADAPYADRYDPAARIRSLTPEEIVQIERGEGAGFALPAELNGLPGPRHVLDLADQLRLSPEQRRQVQRVFDDMQVMVIPAGQRYLAAVAILEEDIRTGQVTEGALSDRVAEVYRLEGDLATAHLTAHWRTAEILTADQIDLYQQLRGYE